MWAEGAPTVPDVRLVVLSRPRADLYARIESRVDAMVAGGLIDENRHLLAAGHTPETPPLRTIGYAEPIRFLRGEITEGEMVRMLKQNTRRYAKRQLTWFRRYPEARWVDLSFSDFDSVHEWFTMQ